MTDLETMRAMLAKAGVSYSESKTEPIIRAKISDDTPAMIYIEVVSNSTAVFRFTLDGALIDVGAYD